MRSLSFIVESVLNNSWCYLHIYLNVQKILRERHGRVDDLQMYLGEPKEENEITNEMLTLKQIGCEGVIPDVSTR
jgi:hypothetical protein